MHICGVDDAGRGSMLGPLVIAGISIKKSKLYSLRKLGVKDSKKLSPRIREELYSKIINLADDYHIARIQPRSIDVSVKIHALNHLEAKYMARVITKLEPNVSYVDSCDVNPRRFGKEISILSGNRKIHSYHHADDRFAVVSAASIIAKVSRDRSISRLQRNYDLGSGYPSDSKTIQFVRSFYNTYNKFPSFVRQSWKPARVLANS